MYICSVCNNSGPSDARFCSWCGTVINGQGQVKQQVVTGLLEVSGSLLHNGRYAILKKVGQGGMGAVYKAQDCVLNKRIVAIKEMSQNGLAGQELQKAIAAFKHEAEILSRLKHQSLPHIYEQFEEEGRHYLVMEFIEGGTLDKILEKQYQTLPLDQVLNIGRQLCEVLSYLHAQQPPVIFRDLKPTNIMLDAHGQVYLIDFGIARLFKQGQLKDTTALGSAGYAPPEQYRHATSPRSDIYSLGATLHQMLTGDDPSEAPFQFQPFSINNPPLEKLITSMVAVNEAHRPATVNEVLEVLNETMQASVTPTKIAQVSTLSSQISSSPSIAISSTICAIVSPSLEDRKVWTSLKDQLASELHLFPKVVIKENIGTSISVDQANLILLLLSDDFLAASNCIKSANQAIDRTLNQNTEVLSVLLRPFNVSLSLYTNPEKNRLARIRMISQDPIAHLSIYAQEQCILDISKAIREQLVRLLLPDNNDGSMNLHQWLLWQLYGNGHQTCPYFVIGMSDYALKYIRTSAFGTGMLIHLLDLQDNQIIDEYIIGSPDRSDLTNLLQTIAPSTTSLEAVQGIATCNNRKALPFTEYSRVK